MFFECIFLIFLFILYFFIYVDMKINKHNELYLFDSEFTKTNLNKEICLKLPFYFDGQHIQDIYDKSSLTKVKKVKHHFRILLIILIISLTLLFILKVSTACLIVER